VMITMFVLMILVMQVWDVCTDTSSKCQTENKCHIDYCDPVIGCTYNDVACFVDDCTYNSCSPDVGRDSGQISCDDSDACTIDSCDPNSGLFT